MGIDKDDFWSITDFVSNAWDLSERLSVTNAAMLAAGLDPGRVEAARPESLHTGVFRRRGIEDGPMEHHQSSIFVAMFSAIRNAILDEKLRADITRLARHASYIWQFDEHVSEAPFYGEDPISYTLLLRTGGLTLKTNAVDDTWGSLQTIFMIKEPDWSQTMVAVQDLKAWMDNQNIRPRFFFREAKIEEFANENHPRYSAKLAAVVSAWEAVEEADPGRTVKQTLEKWLNTNASKFGLIDDHGRPLPSVITALAEVANWDTRGGAPKTSAPKSAAPQILPEGISNFQTVSKPSS